MGDLTETEIFDCMQANLKLAAEHAEDLAKLPAKGPTYRKFREELKLIEGCCRQASAWRQDTRWLPLGLQMGEAHKRAGDWLRGIKGPDGGWRKLPEGQLHPYFMKLAENLRAMAHAAELIRTRATGRLGMILPKPAEAPFRETRPHAVKLPGSIVTKGGIILPAGTTLQ